MSQRAIKLSTGRMVWLKTFHQESTYAGTIEGLPGGEWVNKSIIEGLLKEHEDKHYPEGPYFIQPKLTPLDLPPEMRSNRRRDPNPMRLPDVTCAALLWCNKPARDRQDDGSYLAVLWFQSEFAFPIDPEILAEIQAIDWERRAADWYF